MLAPDLTGQSIQVPFFSDTEGSQFLRTLLARNSFSRAEVESAEALSHELGGLPLALNLMGKQIKATGRRLGQFLEIYRENPRRLHQAARRKTGDGFYNENLQTAWVTSFTPLEAQLKSKILMGILSCLDPERIPKSMFEAVGTDTLPDDLQFFGDPLE